MTVLRAAALAAVCVVSVSSSAPAQRVADVAHTRVTLAAGFAINERVDGAVSPLHFAGTGVDASATIEWQRARWSLASSLNGVSHAMRARPASAESLEEFQRAEFVIALTHAVATPSPDRGFAFGAAVRASVARTEHRYTDPFLSSATFMIASVTVGPAMTWSTHAVGASARISLDAPALAFASHSYGDEKAQRAATRFRPAWPSTFRGAHAALALEPATAHRFGVNYRYELSALRFDDVPAVRSVSQSFRVGLVTRF